jgi:hypothetical protein
MVAGSGIWQLFNNLYDSHRKLQQPFLKIILFFRHLFSQSPIAFQDCFFSFIIRCWTFDVRYSSFYTFDVNLLTKLLSLFLFSIHHSMLNVRCSMFIFLYVRCSSFNSFDIHLLTYCLHISSRFKKGAFLTSSAICGSSSSQCLIFPRRLAA